MTQTLVPTLPENAPFTAEQRAWLNGFLAGIFSRAPLSPVAAGATAQPAPLTPLTILFGSQTGTAERLAKRAAKEAGKRGFAPTVLDMAQTTAAKLASEKSVLVITSTYGEGEPPDNAKALLAALRSDATASCASIRYSVCGLGDRNYTQFCQCGKEFDAMLEKRGAVRVSARVDCDIDYETPFARWLDSSLTALSSPPGAAPTAGATGGAVGALAAEAPAEPESVHSKANPFPALLLTSRKLNGEGSVKEVRHVEFSLEGSDLAYEAGDALGVVPQNCMQLVSEVLAAAGFDGEEAVTAPDSSTISLRHALLSHYDLGKPAPELLATFSGGTSGSGGTAVALAQPHVIDVILSGPDVRLEPATFVSLLRPLQPRLYSISSSPKAHPGQVHLTVAAVRYEAANRLRKGVCSTFLADRIVPGETRIGIYVHRNRGFRPPSNPDTPIIMVGPGTGIAPFRAFLHERRATGSKGKNWLFFGDQRSATDFLYHDELQSMRHEGLLTRLDTAFSRDQQEKVYVQHRMLENAAELYRWLQDGAHFYICGDAAHMAKDVEAALTEVIAKIGGKTSDEAAEYIDWLRAEKRYQRDVY